MGWRITTRVVAEGRDPGTQPAGTRVKSAVYSAALAETFKGGRIGEDAEYDSSASPLSSARVTTNCPITPTIGM